jgi:hypothetical protein
LILKKRLPLDSNWPRLLYLADVPVEASCHGSALIHRLLQDYPCGDLRVIEGSEAPSISSRRLEGVTYFHSPPAMSRWMHTRMGRWVGTARTLRAESKAPGIRKSIGGFTPEAVLTVAHGDSWLTAARFAKQENLPLHLIVHDDWPEYSPVLPAFRNWAARSFANVYRGAASRLCVSPYMRDEYERRYGVSGDVLYPSRAKDSPVWSAPPDRLLRREGPFTCVYAGSINSVGYVQALQRLSSCIARLEGRLIIYGPTSPESLRQMGLEAPHITAGGMVPSSELIARCRDEADVLYVPMSFAPQDRAPMALNFPSKLTDYTSSGVPLLIVGAPDSSAVKWARENPGVAEVIDSEEESPLYTVLEHIKRTPAHAHRLGSEALRVGRSMFSHTVVSEVFLRAINHVSAPTMPPNGVPNHIGT